MDALTEHLGHVRRYVTRLVRGRRHLIDDYVQETMLEACRSIDKHGPPIYPKAWLAQIAYHVVCQGSGALRRRPGVAGAPEQNQSTSDGTVLDMVVKADEEARLRDAVELLSNRDNSAINKYYWQDLACPEIGEQMGMTESAVKTRLHRSRAEVGQRLGAEKRR